MAEYFITGGGTALDDALNKRNGFNYTNGDTLYVRPGIYSPINFAQYLKNVEVRSTDGKENTIIDANHLTSCLDNRYVNSGYIFHFYGFTLRNGYISTDISGNSLSNYQDVEGARTFNLSGAALNGAIYLYDSNIFDCESYCKYPYANWKNNEAYGNICGVASANPTHQFYNCEISGCRSNTMFLRNTNLNWCDFHHNECTRRQNGDKTSFWGVTCRKSKLHDNRISGIFLDGNPKVDTLIYRNYGLSGSAWLSERSHIINCVIANNIGFDAGLENGWGGPTYWKNNVIVGNRNYNGSYTRSVIYGNGGRSTILNCYFDQLSNSIVWSGWNELSGNNRKGSVFIKDADFGFVNIENDDYRLRPDSMLIGKGTWDVLSGKAPTDTAPSYNGTSENIWLSANGDFTSRKFNDPPSVGAYEYIEEKQHIPNDIYPFGTVSIPTSVPSNWTYKITFENVDTSNAHSYDAGLRNYSNVVYYKGPFNLSPGGSTIFTIYVDTNDPDPIQFSDCTGMCMADPGSGGNFVMLWNNMIEFANVNGGYNTDTPTAQLYDGVTGTITIEKKV